VIATESACGCDENVIFQVWTEFKVIDRVRSDTNYVKVEYVEYSLPIKYNSRPRAPVPSCKSMLPDLAEDKHS
jgi:hypothetical protein